MTDMMTKLRPAIDKLKPIMDTYVSALASTVSTPVKPLATETTISLCDCCISHWRNNSGCLDNHNKSKNNRRTMSFCSTPHREIRPVYTHES